MIIGKHGVEFRKDGSVHDQGQVTALFDGLGGAAELLVLSHGWNNDRDGASRMYTHFLNSLAQVRDAATSPALAVLEIFWPSKRFSSEDLIPGGAASGDSDEALRRARGPQCTWSATASAVGSSRRPPRRSPRAVRPSR